MFFIINPFYKKGVLTFCICRIRMVSKRKLGFDRPIEQRYEHFGR